MLFWQREVIKCRMASILNIHMEMPNIHNGTSFTPLKLDDASIAQPFSLVEPVRPAKPTPSSKPKLKTSL